MRISNRTIYAVAGVVALVTISTRLQSNTPQAAEVDDITVAPQGEPPVSRYLGTRGSISTSQRAASEVSGRVPIANLPAGTSATQVDSDVRAQTLAEDEEPIVNAPTTVSEPIVSSGVSGFDESGMLTQASASEPARAGELTDQAVYELFVSSLDDENRRSFRASWALMTSDERQQWIAGARTALSGQ